MQEKIVKNMNAHLFQCVVFPVLLVVAWVLLYQDAILSAAQIWYVSEIFSHGFFIIPGSLYFIWRERDKLTKLTLVPNYWVLPFLVAFLMLGVLGVVGGVQVFSHIAAFTVLPLAIWFCVGNAIAKVIWFPLCFMLFSIPIGEQLVPYLQQITAELAIGLLSWTTIPVFSTGLYIEIPQGKFVVAEACSGIRFFVGSLVFGAVYSHVSYRSFKRKVAFMFLALVVPLVANAVRVFGIVVIGYFIDMEYASGADHIIYGWVFFAIVLFLLVVFGELFREKDTVISLNDSAGTSVVTSVVTDAENNKALSFSLSRPAFCTLLGLLTLVLVWQKVVVPNGAIIESAIDSVSLEALNVTRQHVVRSSWSPIIKGESDLYRGFLEAVQEQELSELANVDVVLAWYPENRDGAELVSSSNALFDKESWSKMGEESVNVSIQGETQTLSLLKIMSHRGVQRLVLYWYQLPNKALNSGIKAKLYQSIDVLFGGKGAGALIALSSTYSNDSEQNVRSALTKSAEQMSSALYKALPY
jgi:exosortase A